MIIYNTNKPFVLLGFENSTFTQEYYEALTHFSNQEDVEIIEPKKFEKISNKHQYQYILGFALELDLRKKLSKLIKSENLDCFSYIHDNCFISPNCTIGKGVFIGPFCSVCRNAEVKDHACLLTYCLVSHYSTVGKNTIVNSGAKIAGRTTIGENCTLGIKSGVSKGLSVCSDVHLKGFSNITKDIEIPGTYVGVSAKLRQ